MDETENTDERVRILSRETAFEGYFRVDRYRLTHRTYDGGWGAEITREVFERGHAAAVLPYDAERDEVILIEQFRVGALSAGLDPWVTEVVAGIIEDGEDPERVVRREAEEEAGIGLAAMEEIGTFLPSPGGCSETIHLYCGQADLAGAGGLHGLAHEGEDIRASVHGFSEAMKLMHDGAIRNLVAVAALQWLALNRERLRRAWCPSPDTREP